MELKTHCPRAAGGKRVHKVVPDPTRHHRVEVRQNVSTGDPLPISIELLCTGGQPITYEVSVEGPAREWLVDRVPVDLGEEAGVHSEQPSQLLAVRGIRV